ncbi:MAG: FISUMP domain-containing protein [Dysgonomonas sp.]
MNISRFFSYLFGIVLLLVPLILSGQVTIGSQREPANGAILDLKQKDNNGVPFINNATANRGLGLPRVILSDLTKLKMGTNEILDGSDNQYEKHTGLMVYNLGDDPYCPTIESGVYVWDSKKWQSTKKTLAPKTNQTNFDTTTGILTDYEGNTYTTKLFEAVSPAYSRRWMTQNLRSIYDKNGELIGCIRMNPAFRETENGGVIFNRTLPTGIIGNYTNGGVVVSGQSYSNYAKEFGFLYNWPQAVIACPEGWSVPTPEEWSELCVALGGTGTSSSGSVYPNLIYDVAHKMKKNNNTIYRSADTTPFQNTWGTSGIIENGFNAVPAGSVPNGTSATDFTLALFMWTATSGSYRVITSSSYINAITGGSTAYFLSVRCIQD